MNNNIGGIVNNYYEITHTQKDIGCMFFLIWYAIFEYLAIYVSFGMPIGIGKLVRDHGHGMGYSREGN